MYIVRLSDISSGINGESTAVEIHGKKEKLESGRIIKGINTIDTFTFSMLPNNPGFNFVREFQTCVEVYNTNTGLYDFRGRVLYTETTMSEDGLITKTVTCESILGFLWDSYQEYREEVNRSVGNLLSWFIAIHNKQVEEYKQIHIGNITAVNPDENYYVGIQRETTWEAIKTKLLDKFGGELQFRVEEDGIYLDYLDRIGEEKTTEIALSKNMKSITREQDPTAFVTRLIPLGYKLKKVVDYVYDEDGNPTDVVEEETEYRLDIAEVNNGLKYIDNEEAIALYGVHVGVVEWDDVTEPMNLLNKGRAWLKENSNVQVKYSISALDLSLIGLAVDDFNVGNIHPIKNRLLGIDDTARIIKKTIDICQEVESSIEIGDSFKTLSDIQRDQAEQIKATTKSVENINYSTTTYDQKLDNLDKKITSTATRLENKFHSEIVQLSDSIKLDVSGSLGGKASIILSSGTNKYTGELDLAQIRKAFADDSTAISISAGTITFNSNTIVINSTNFSVTSDGTITAKAGTIGGWTLQSYKLQAGDGVNIKTVVVEAPTQNTTYVFAAGGRSHDDYGDCPFRVTKNGKLYATDAIISGSIVSIDSPYKTEIDFGSLRLYYDDNLCGTVNTKYWSGASNPGISLRAEEGGKYIMFSHADDTQGSGYVVDYYLNAGWSSNYDEMHIFQTSARFLDDAYFAGKTRIRSLRLFGSDGEYLVGINSSGGLSISKL